MLSLILALAVLAPPTPREQFEALKAEYDASLSDYNRRHLGGETPIPEDQVDWVAVYRDYPPWCFAPRFLALAEANPGNPAAVDVLFWVANQVSADDRDRTLAPLVARALEILARSHLDDPRVDTLCWSLSVSAGSDAAGQFLRTASEQAASREVRGRAGLGYARFLNNRRQLTREPWFDREPKTKVEAMRIDRLDPSYVRSLRGADRDALRAEAGRQFARVAKEYGDVRADPRPERDQTIAQMVDAELFAILHLDRGDPAPEIEGVDADDRQFKLSDYRGKVVVLTFSGNWCGPCVGMYPGERALVERYKGRPFAILSVNTDSEKATLRKSIEAGVVTWRCWWDGAIDGPITTAWNVRSFPTVYVLDAKGIIREKHLRGERLDEAVAGLMAETTAKP